MESYTMGIGQRIRFAFRAFVSLLFYGTLAPDIADVARRAVPGEDSSTTAPGARTTASSGASAGTSTAAVLATAAATPADGAVQILSLLQRDGRLIDFLMEDLATYPDAQVGTAVRDVHTNCRRTLDKYLELEPILDGVEDQTVTLPVVDPAEVKVVGRTAGAPPIRGVLRHRGWRNARIELPSLPPAAARRIVAQAEVEIP